MFELAMELDTDYREATTIAVEVAKRALAADRAKLADQVRALYSETDPEFRPDEFWVDREPYIRAAAVLALIEDLPKT